MQHHQRTALASAPPPEISGLGYFKTWAALAVLTALTVAASHVELDHTASLALAMAIATVKAALVAAIFMHLREDGRFHSLILAFSLLFLAIFIGFTLLDTSTRDLDPTNAPVPERSGPGSGTPSGPRP